MPGLITCKKLIEFLMSYLDGEMPPEQRREVDRHLAVCPSCLNYLRTYERTVRLGREAFAPTDDPPPADVPKGLIGAMLAARSVQGNPK